MPNTFPDSFRNRFPRPLPPIEWNSMSINYRTTVNVEWTSKCNALCAMCPRDLIANPQLMRPETW